MHVTVTGKQIDVGEALRHHAEAALQTVAEKYFGNAIEAHAVFSREAHLIHCDLQVHVGRGILVRSEGEGGDAYAAFDNAGGRIEKRLRRHKRRLRDHHMRDKRRARDKGRTRVSAPRPAKQETAATADASADGRSAVIAEMETPILDLSVSEAALRLDLADLPALLFRNRAHGMFNVVFRRRDGNIGWIDPHLRLPRSKRPASPSH
jgi:ribosomal subunit interface protein